MKQSGLCYPNMNNQIKNKLASAYYFLLLVFSFILLSGIAKEVFPQNNDKHPNQLNSTQVSYESFMSTIEALRIFDVPAEIHKGFSDAAGSSADTLSRRISSASDSLSDSFSFWYSFSVITDDTIQVSSSAAFNSTETFLILPDIPYTSIRINPNSITNYYYKVYGTGTPNTYWSLLGL